MGMYLNPENGKFIEDAGDKFYVDKTGVLGELNDMINTPGKCVSLSHARRFGKTQVADMLDAYYSTGCDSHEVFKKFEIASNPSFEKHLNKYNVIHWDVSTFTDICGGDAVRKMTDVVIRDMKKFILMRITTCHYMRLFMSYTRARRQNLSSS